MAKKQDHQFKLEALEPRLLLSGDASAVAADFAVGLDHIPVLVEQLQTSPDHLNQPLPLIGQNLTDIFNPAAQLEDLFAGLTEAELDSPEDLAHALDAESGVDANLVERTDDGFTLDLSVSDVFEGVVPFAVDPVGASTLEQAYGEGLVLYGAVRLSGDWALNLRIIDDSSNEEAPFSIDSTLSSLRVNVAASAPILLSGRYNGDAITDIADLQFQARFETAFREADGHDQIDLGRLSGDALNLLSTTSLAGHAVLTLQRVETLNAAHGPPQVPLFWQEQGARARSTARSVVVSGTDLSPVERPGAVDTLLPDQIGTTGAPEGTASDNWTDPFEVADRSIAGTVVNEKVHDSVYVDGLADLRLGISADRPDFDARVELVFNGLDPPAAPELTVTDQTTDSPRPSLYRPLSSNGGFVPSSLASSIDVNSATPFEFTVVSASPSDLTLRLNGEDLEIIDNLTGALLAGRPLGETSEIIIHGVDNLDDTLTGGH
jgi:hypothetical protein